MGSLIGAGCATIVLIVLTYFLFGWYKEEEDKYLQPRIFVLGLLVGAMALSIPISQLILYWVGN